MSRKKALSVFMLAMINVAAIGSVKNWPVIAEYGFSSLFFFVLATLIFFLPVSLISAELATGWPNEGGIFIWVKEAFGQRTGFLAIWLLWVENVIWYPTILSFIAATIAYIFDPSLSNSSLYLVSIILPVFWLTTLINLLGMRTSGWISTIGVVFGSFIPAGIIIGLGLFWYFEAKPMQISFTLDSLIPNMSNIEQLVFFTGVLLAFCGMEMSAIHARDVQNPQRNYPRAILLSSILILGLSILGVLAIAIVIPQKEISLVAGSMQAFSYFVSAYGLKWITPVMAFLITLGALGGLSTWIVGPSRGLLVAARNGDLPPFFRKANKHGMPTTLLITQAVIVSVLSLLFLYMPSLNSAYWIINNLTAQLYLVMYVIMFAAAIKLRYKRPNVPRAYRVPGGNLGMWIIGSVGMVGASFTMLIGFFPPAQISTGNSHFYVSFLVGAVIVACVAPSIILRFKKPSWSKALAHEK